MAAMHRADLSGVRHDILLTIAYRLRQRGMTGEEVFAELEEKNRTIFLEPLSQVEVASIAVKSIATPPGYVTPAQPTHADGLISRIGRLAQAYSDTAFSPEDLARIDLVLKEWSQLLHWSAKGPRKEKG